ncbi:MAG: DUF1570 domain-containing protein [Planctomycetes bacterium]|nr:DUF1570 domain-containing protein [Planctomycetota bacterium]
MPPHIRHDPHPRWPLAAALLLLISLAHAAAAQVVPETVTHDPPPKLTSFKSKFYTVQTNLTVEEARPIAEHMDAVFAEYSRRFASFPARNAELMPLYLLRTQKQYEGLLGSNGINAANTGGMFFIQRTIQGLATFTQGRNLSATYVVLQHEGFHQFAYSRMGTNLPIWVNEGLAQYFEDGILTQQHGMYVGLANARRLASVQSAIAHSSILDIDELLARSQDEWHQIVVAGGEGAGLQYDQSWSLVYFLIHGDSGKYKAAFEKYLTLVSQGRSSVSAFSQSFGATNNKAFRDRWIAFTEKATPDPLNISIVRMEFLGAGLKFLLERQHPMPKTLDELRQVLISFQFALTRYSPGVKIVQTAGDESLYAFPRNGQDAPFLLLEPSASGLPPRITAQGLKPEPTLVWSRDKQGNLVQDMQFK